MADRDREVDGQGGLAKKTSSCVVLNSTTKAANLRRGERTTFSENPELRLGARTTAPLT
jgi:hypothetical protein